MSRHGDIVFEWAGEERTFRLGIGEWRKLQERTNAGPLELLRRVTTGTWRVDDLRETLRLSLEGAGLTPTEAGRLVRDYVDPPKPLLDSVYVAARILEAGLSGAPDEELPKSEGEESLASPSPTENSPSPSSTDGDQSSDTHQSKSTECLSGSSEPVSAAL